jgi:PIN domain nuclease of toxin-antitoxin system
MLLLDSQVALWVVSGSPRLGHTARRLIETTSPVLISVATVWELTIKAMLGKVKAPAGLANRLRQQGLELMDIAAEHAEAIREFPELLNHDPFDRLIIAQAHMSGARLLTADRVLLALNRDFVVNAAR